MLKICIHKPLLLQGLDLLLEPDTLYGSNHNEILILISFWSHYIYYLPDASMDFRDSKIVVESGCKKSHFTYDGGSIYRFFHICNYKA